MGMKDRWWRQLGYRRGHRVKGQAVGTAGVLMRHGVKRQAMGTVGEGTGSERVGCEYN